MGQKVAMEDSQTQLIENYKDGGVLVLRLNRPDKMNALSMQMYNTLSDGLEEASASDDIGAVVICAVGDNFSAGNDMKDFMALATGPAKGSIFDIPVVKFLHILVNFEKPLVVAIQGRAVGIGLTLSLHGDMVYLSESAKLSAPFVDLGLVPEAGSSMLLPKVVGHAKASEILLLGSAVTATAAKQMGLANEVLPESELFKTALGTAQSLAAKPRIAMRHSKALLHYDKPALIAQMEKELTEFFTRLRSDEAKAAVTAFLTRKS